MFKEVKEEREIIKELAGKLSIIDDKLITEAIGIDKYQEKQNFLLITSKLKPVSKDPI